MANMQKNGSTEVYSVTWSFRNHSNMLIWLLLCLTVVLLNIFVETY